MRRELSDPRLPGLSSPGSAKASVLVINAASYIATIVALLKMKFAEPPRRDSTVTSISRSLIEGYQYTMATTPIRDLLILLGVVGVMGMPYMTLMPVFAAQVHGSGADTLGIMFGAVGLGALTGALFLAQRKNIIGLGRVIVFATLGFGVGLVCFTASQMFWLSLLLLVGVGYGWMVLIAASNTVLQTLADNQMRGRVMSLFSMMLVGMAPFGSLLAGWAADQVGAPMVVAIGGGFCAIAGIVFARRLPGLRDSCPDDFQPTSRGGGAAGGAIAARCRARVTCRSAQRLRTRARRAPTCGSRTISSTRSSSLSTFSCG